MAISTFDSEKDDLDFDDNNDGDFTDIINVSGDLGLDFMAAPMRALSSRLQTGSKFRSAADTPTRKSTRTRLNRAETRSLSPKMLRTDLLLAPA